MAYKSGDMDPLSDLLRAVRLTGAYFFLAEGAKPWSVAAAPAGERTPRVLPDAEHLMAYHVMTEGSCWGGLLGEPPVHMSEGDVLVFPHGDAHLMSSGPDNRSTLKPNWATPPRFPLSVLLGQGARESSLVCGFLGCDLRPFNPLISALPRVIHMRPTGDGWLSTFPEQAVRESRAGRVGSDTMLTRMAELMFIEVVRRHLETIGPEQTGWLAGLRDPVVGAALTLLHARPAHAWTLADLAQEASTSRSVLAERFTQVLGVPPMQYLAQWRLQLAAELLASGRTKIAAVGAQVGYESEAAFSRAFKRGTGVSPSAWRARRRPG